MVQKKGKLGMKIDPGLHILPPRFRYALGAESKCLVCESTCAQYLKQMEKRTQKPSICIVGAVEKVWVKWIVKSIQNPV